MPIAERFDPVTQQSSAITIEGSTSRSGHSATLLTDGRVLIAGGTTGDSGPAPTEIWDLQTATATSLTDPLARSGHAATLREGGTVLITGGRAADGPGGGARGDRRSGHLVDRRDSSAQPGRDGALPVVAASTPASGATDVALDTRVVVRFSDPVRVDSVTDATVSLAGTQGAVRIKVVGAEQGRLLFVTPLEMLREGETVSPRHRWRDHTCRDAAVSRVHLVQHRRSTRGWRRDRRGSVEPTHGPRAEGLAH